MLSKTFQEIMSVNASPKLKKKTPRKVKTPRIGPEGDSVVQNGMVMQEK